MILEDKVLDIIESKAKIRVGSSEASATPSDAPEGQASNP